MTRRKTFVIKKESNNNDDDDDYNKISFDKFIFKFIITQNHDVEPRIESIKKK